MAEEKPTSRQQSLLPGRARTATMVPCATTDLPSEEPLTSPSEANRLTSITESSDGDGNPSAVQGDIDVPLWLRRGDRYQILAEHGRGGIGRVYRARDKELLRDVALKELLEPTHRGEARFVREALITARLEHPGIVPVHEAGRWQDGTPFYAMKLVSGRPLSELLARMKTLLERLSLLSHLIAIADAIAYAHSRGVIHRDLKPSNVIIGDFGETVVVDWGLAKELGAPRDAEAEQGPYRMANVHELTVAGSIVGTPAYMSPEQARGEAVDTRTDVYSLGAMLLQLCIGTSPRPRRTNRSGHLVPHDGADAARPVSARVSGAASDPVPFHEPRDPGIPADLAAIASKAMAQDPDDRYATAREFAEDLKRFHTGQLVAARRYRSWERFGRWLARRRVLVAASSITALVMVASFALVLQQLERARTSQRHERAARQQVEARRNELTLVHARTSLDSDPTSAIAWLKTYPEDGPDWSSVRDIAVDAVSRRVARHVLFGHTDKLFRVYFTSDGLAVASSGSDSTARIWDVATGRGSILASGLAEMGLFGLDPSGRWLAYAAQDNAIYLVDRNDGGKRRLGQHSGMVQDLSFSADGGTLVSAGADGVIWLWDLPTLRRRELHTRGGVDRAELDGSGQVVASCGADKRLLLWNIQSGAYQVLGSCDAGHSDRAFAFTAGGEALAVGHLDGSISIWDRQQNRRIVVRGQEESSSKLALSGKGDLVAAGDSHGDVRVWSTATGAEVARFRASAAVTFVDLSPNGELVVVGTIAGPLLLRDLVHGSEWRLLGHTNYVAEARFSPDGALIASSSGDKSVRIWRVPTARARILRGHAKEAYHPVWDADGSTIWAEGGDSTIRAWDVRTGRETNVLAGHQDRVYGLALLPARSESLVSAGWDGTVRVWNRATGTATELRGHNGIVWSLAVSPASGLFASGGADGTVRLWDARGQALGVIGRLDGQVYGLAISPDGQFVGAGTSAGIARIWHIDGSVARSLRVVNDTFYRPFLFGHDDATLITGGKSGVVRRWGIEDDGLDSTLYKHAGPVRVMELTRDGRWLVSGGVDGQVCYTELSAQQLLTRCYTAHVSPIKALALSSRHSWIATGAEDGTIRMVERHSGDTRLLHGHALAVFGLAFSPDGAMLASASMDGTVRIWPIADAARDEIAPGKDSRALHSWLDQITTASIDRDSIARSPTAIEE